MALGETARLLAELDMQDNLSPKAAGAIGSVRKLEGAVASAGQTTGRMGRVTGAASGGLTRLRSVAGGASGALGHLRGQVGSLLGAAGFLGLAGAGLGVAEALHHSIDAAVELGATSRRLAALTGGTTEAMSGLSAGLAHFGLEADTQIKLVGMLQKNLGLLASGEGKKAQKFLSDFGFSVTDSSGKVKSAQQVINDFTDFFNDDAIPASQKAAVGAKLFGRSWQDLIPVLSAGKGALQEATAEAATFGETLTDKDVDSLAKMRDATRKWHTALAGLETQIGLAVVPAITDLATAATDFLADPNNRASIVGFFKQGVQFARDFAGFVKDSVLPTVRDLATAGKNFWEGLPAPLRDLLVKGFVADRTVKFLFGFSLADVGKDVLGGAISGIVRGIAGNFLARGSSPANPMFVQGTGIGGATGGATGGLLGAGSSRLVQAVSIISIVGSALAVIEAFKDFLGTRDQAQRDLQEKADAAAHQTAQEALGNLQHLDQTLGNQGLWESLVTNTFGAAQTSEGLTNLANAVVNNGKVSDVEAAIKTLQGAQAVAIQRGWTSAADAIGANIAALQQRQSAPAGGFDGGLSSSGSFGSPVPVSDKQSADQVQELQRINQQAANQLGQMVSGLQGIDGSIGALDHSVTAFVDSWGEVQAEAVASGFKPGSAAIRREIAKNMNVTVHELARLRSTYRSALADELGITTGELRHLRRSTHYDEQAMADKLGITVEQLRLLKDEARTTAANTTKLKNKDWTVNVDVTSKNNLYVSAREVAQQVVRSGYVLHPRVD